MRFRAPASLLLLPALMVGFVQAAAVGPEHRGSERHRSTTVSLAPEPRLRISGVTLFEGDETTRAVFLVTSSRPADARVHFRTIDGSAVAGLDYAASSGTLVFSTRKTTRRVAVQITGDAFAEPDETFSVELFRPRRALIARSSARGTITNDDTGAGISVADVTVTEGQSGTTTAAFRVTLSVGLPGSVTVGYATGDGSAVSADDYAAMSGTLTFDPGETLQQILVPIVGDKVAETNETFAFNLSNPTGASLADGVGIGTITDDDTVSISVANATVTEGNSGTLNAAFGVTLSAASSQAVTVSYATADGSATSPADYQSTAGTLTFDPGETALQILVPVVGDTSIENAELFSVNLSNAVNATLADPAGQGTITDNDTMSISVANATVTEGNSGTLNAAFGVTLSAASSQTVTVSYATADGSATSPADYQVTSGTLTFDPGVTALQILVPVVGDTVIENAELFSVNLSNAVNATLADPAAQGTITDNDTVSISIGNVTVTEGNSGTLNAVFTLTLSAVSGSTVTVDFATANGSATAPADYLATNGTVTFAPGEVSKQIIVSIVGDTAVETNETYSVNLSNPTNATISGSGFGLGTINNND
jgi:Calx-beta domain